MGASAQEDVCSSVSRPRSGRGNGSIMEGWWVELGSVAEMWGAWVFGFLDPRRRGQDYAPHVDNPQGNNGSRWHSKLTEPREGVKFRRKVRVMAFSRQKTECALPREVASGRDWLEEMSR